LFITENKQTAELVHIFSVNQDCMAMPSGPSSWPPGSQVIALYNFHGNSVEDLPFRRGDILTIVQKTNDPNWYQAKNAEGKHGMLPANYVQQRAEVKLHAMPWMHGKISREQAEDLLKPRSNGLYLVRESTSFPGDYTLCVCFSGSVEHYRVYSRDCRLTIDDESFFKNLTQLIEHYENDADGLCTRLTKPLQKDGYFDVSVDQEAFIESGWQIKLKDIKLSDQIGKGEFGEVCKGDYLGTQVAVKVLRDKSTAQQFLAEASVMTSLKHPHLVQLLGVVLSDTTYIVTEFMAKGSLVDYLRTRGRTVITSFDQINFAYDTCQGMAYLEMKHIVHRDLAARNVLVHESGTAKVSDFGLARPISCNQAGGKFPIKWTAPEALRDSVMFTNKSDVWSFGVLLWEIYSFGRVPYPRIPLTDVVMHVERGYRMEAPEGCPKEIYDIMQVAWNKDPTKRPNFSEMALELKALHSVTS